MANIVQMPALGESVTDGIITRWLKQVGDHVEIDEPLLEVSTDKVDTEVPSPVSGVLQQILAEVDTTVDVGGELAVIGAEAAGTAGISDDADGRPEGSTPAPEPAEELDRVPPSHAASLGGGEVSQQVPAPSGSGVPENTDAGIVSSNSDGAASGGSPRATPLVRKLAAECGVDLAGVTGTGSGGRIRKQDVVNAAGGRGQAQDVGAAAPATSAGTAPPTGGMDEEPVRGVPGEGGAPRLARPGGTVAHDDEGLRGSTRSMSRRRATIARRMHESLQVSAQLTTVVEVDLTRIAHLRDRAKVDFQCREGVKLSFLPFMARAAIEALKAHPVLNASVDAEKKEITYHGTEHLGIAVDSPEGLVVPVIHQAGDLNIGGLARKIADVAERTRANKISPEELSGGTFTITNTGSRGALMDTPIINQPEVGILGTGAVVKRPTVVTDSEGDESIAVRSMAYLCLSYDHRIVDGADAARFLGSVKARLEAGRFEDDLGL